MIVKKIENNEVIDWCYSCAEPFCQNSEEKMFAWIVLYLLRNIRESWFFNDDKTFFRIDLKCFDDNDAIQEYLCNLNYWKFLPEIIHNYLVMNTCDLDIDRNNTMVVDTERKIITVNIARG